MDECGDGMQMVNWRHDAQITSRVNGVENVEGFSNWKGGMEGLDHHFKCTTKVEAANRLIILDSKLLSSPTLFNARRPAEASS